MEQNIEFNSGNSNLQVTELVKSGLLEAAKWAKLISVISFIGLGLMVLMGFFMGSIMATSLNTIPGMSEQANPMGILGGGFFIIVYGLIALLYFFPIKYLFDFSNKVKQAIQIKDQQLFTEAIFKLKSHYKYIGILMIIMMSFYALILVFSIIGGIAAASLS